MSNRATAVLFVADERDFFLTIRNEWFGAPLLLLFDNGGGSVKISSPLHQCKVKVSEATCSDSMCLHGADRYRFNYYP
jgi:hypothetical protein